MRDVAYKEGYGTDAPDSPVGRIFCLVYLFFGIPLYLITLADLAKFCTEFMNKLYIDIIKCKYRMRRKYRRWRSGLRTLSSAHILEESEERELKHQSHWRR
ncbi:hypothetical protein OSTOST_04569 [Ostertagia ostertagi]